MKPAAFEYAAPTSLGDALEMLASGGPEARLLAGGQSLVPMMNFRLARPRLLIDLNGVASLDGIAAADGHCRIGAMTRQRAIENSDVVRRRAPLLHEATTHVAHLPIRSRGTIGGSLANADPAAEYPAAAIALDCTMVARSARGERRIAAADFFLDVFSTALDADEILTQILVPDMPPASGSAFAEIARRRGDFALAGVAARITLDGGAAADVRLAACGVGAAAVRLRQAEAAIRGGGTGADAVEAAAAAAAGEVEPETDIHASAAYRRRLTAAMTRRALAAAIARAEAGR